MIVPGATHIEKLFREVAGMDLDKSDLARVREFVDGMVYRLLVSAVARARANGRDIIQPQDLPVSAGLQERIHEFRGYEVAVELEPLLKSLEKLPPLELDYAVEVEEVLPEIIGGLTVALAHLFTVVEPGLKNPQTEHWEKVERIFRLLY